MSVVTYSAQNAISYKHQINTKSKLIYVSTLLTFSLSIFSLPFIKISISTKGSGMLQSSQEKAELTIPVDGRLIKLNMKDNLRIKKGDTVLVIDAVLPQQLRASRES